MWLIIGGSGFIGINFAKFLMENGYDFKIYDINKSKYLPMGVETIIGDVRDKTKLSKAMNGCDIVFHLATVPPSLKLPKNEVHDIDVNGTKNVLETAKENKVKKVIFTSSASHVYGIVDPGSCPLSEDCKLNPINEYGRNKVLSEELCKKAAENTDLKTIVLRLSMVLGPYNFDPILVENLKPLLMNKRVIIAGDGKSKSQSVHVQDVNTSLLACAEIQDASLSKHDIFNISGKEVLSIKESLELFKSVCDSKSKVSHLPLPVAKFMAYIAWMLNKTNVHPSYLRLMAEDQYFDISKAKRVLGWEPKYTVKDGLEDAIDFLRKESNNKLAPLPPVTTEYKSSSFVIA